MPERHVAVCMKVTPKPEEIEVDRETMLILREGARSEINPPDMNAVELALQLKDQSGCKISILSMGPMFFDPYLRVALAMGADELYLLSDRAFAGADTLATTYVLARAIEKIGDVDLVICGEESSDGATGQVPPGLAAWLGWPVVSMAVAASFDADGDHVRIEREAHGRSIVSAPFPAVLAVKTASNQPRFMDYEQKHWAFEDVEPVVWCAQDLNADPDRIGLKGSPTTVSGLRQAGTRARKREHLVGEPAEIALQLVDLLQSQLLR